MATRTKKKSSRHHPPVSATPAQRQKFVLLCVFASVVVMLLWILTLLVNTQRETSGAGPKQFFQVIGSYVSTGKDKFQHTYSK